MKTNISAASFGLSAVIIHTRIWWLLRAIIPLLFFLIRSFFFFQFLFFSEALFASQGLIYHGRILKSDNTPLESSAVLMRVQIRSPGTENCLLYEETKTVDMTGSGGVFSFTLNDGTGTRTDSTSYPLAKIFSNRVGFTLTHGECASGTSYTPTASENRKFVFSFKEAGATSYETIAAEDIQFAPTAMESLHVGGYSAANLCRVEDASIPQTVTPLTSANFTELLALVNGTSTKYMSTSANGATLPNLTSSPPTSAPAGSLWYEGGVLKYSDGTATPLVLGTSSGAVSGNSITTGTIAGNTAMNTSGNISTTGTVTGATVSGTTVSGTTISGGTITGTTITGTTINGGTVTATNASITTASVRSLVLNDNTPTTPKTITLHTPNTIGSNYSLTLPSAVPAVSGYVLSSDTSGVMSWISPTAPLASANILVGNSSNVATAVSPSGDVSMTNAGAFTVTGVKGKTVSAAPTVTGQVLRYDGTNWTPNFISMFDLRSTVTGISTFGSGSTGCTSGQTLTWTAVTDNLSCTNIAVSDSQVSFASKTANTFLAAPNGAAGAPVFRAIAAADLPSGAYDTTYFKNGGNAFAGTATIGTSDANSLVLNTSGLARMTVLSGGNVGIGTSSPGYSLDVKGAINSQVTGTGATSNTSYANFTAYNPLNNYPVGQFLIGQTTSDVVAGLQVAPLYSSAGSQIPTNISISTNKDGLNANSYQTIIKQDSTVLNIGTYKASSSGAGTPIAFSPAGNETVRILTNGNVGIGTTNPTAALQLKAGTAAANTAPLKLTSGTNLTTPEDGAIEYDGTSLYFTDSTATRRTLASTSASSQTFSGNVVLGGAGTGLAVTNNATVGGTFGVTGTTTLGGGATVSANQNFTMASGTGQFTQTYSGTGPAHSITGTAASSGDLLDLITSTTAAGSGDKALNVGVSGANASASVTRYGVYSNVTATGATSTNVGGYFSASGATNNYGLIVPNGNVGIGTTSPGNKLSVGNTNFTYQTGYDGIDIANTGSSSILKVGQDSTHQLQFRWDYNATVSSATANLVTYGYSNPLKIDASTLSLQSQSGGNVGIGTTSPSSLLNVSGSSATGDLTVSNSSTAGSISLASLLAPSGASDMYFSVGNALTTANTALVGFHKIGAGSTSNYAFLTTYGRPASDFAVTATGNVGIGTASPQYLLHVGATNGFIISPNWAGAGELPGSASLIGSNTGNLNLYPSVSNGASGSKIVLGYSDGSINRSALEVANASGFSNLLLMKSGGNVGIGTASPDQPLSVSGRISIQNSGTSSGYLGANTGGNFISFTRNAYETGGNWYRTNTANYAVLNQLFGDNSSSEFQIYTAAPAANPIGNWVKQFGVKNDGTGYFAGKVGIGVTTPDSSLQVAGSIKTSGQIVGGSQTITGGTSTVDWSNGNAISTDYNCASNITLNNFRDGGTYTLIITDTGTTQCSFATTTTGLDAATVTYRFKPSNTTRMASSHSIYTLMRVGTVVYISWTSGF